MRGKANRGRGGSRPSASTLLVVPMAPDGNGPHIMRPWDRGPGPWEPNVGVVNPTASRCWTCCTCQCGARPSRPPCIPPRAQRAPTTALCPCASRPTAHPFRTPEEVERLLCALAAARDHEAPEGLLAGPQLAGRHQRLRALGACGSAHVCKRAWARGRRGKSDVNDGMGIGLVYGHAAWATAPREHPPVHGPSTVQEPQWGGAASSRCRRSGCPFAECVEVPAPSGGFFPLTSRSLCIAPLLYTGYARSAPAGPLAGSASTTRCRRSGCAGGECPEPRRPSASFAEPAALVLMSAGRRSGMVKFAPVSPGVSSPRPPSPIPPPPSPHPYLCSRRDTRRSQARRCSFQALCTPRHTSYSIARISVQGQGLRSRLSPRWKAAAQRGGIANYLLIAIVRSILLYHVELQRHL